MKSRASSLGYESWLHPVEHKLLCFSIATATPCIYSSEKRVINQTQNYLKLHRPNPLAYLLLVQWQNFILGGRHLKMRAAIKCVLV